MAIRALTDDERDALAEDQARPDLKLLVAQLHRCREDYRTVSEQYAAELRAFEAAHADLLRHCGNLHAAMIVADTAVREAAAEAHGRTGDKHPAPGIQIREHKGLDYDRERAEKWCGANLPIALVAKVEFKHKVFEAAVQQLGLEEVLWYDEPFVTQVTTYDVAIDRDLGKALTEESR